jgi:ribosomal-protein-alanine N-acetyltransferase
VADLDEVLSIEKASFSSPWSGRFFLEELRSPYAKSLLAHVDEITVGYIIYWRLPREVDIHNLAVHPSHRRHGIGRSLLQTVINEAKEQRLDRVTLEVRKSNEAAQRLYQSLGFAARGVRKGYYSDDGEDALIMVMEF